MTDARQVLRETRFANRRLERVGIEIVKLSRLRTRIPSKEFGEAERVEFFMLMMVTEGQGAHLVDFERLALRPGRLVFVRPGQVQQWRPQDRFEADVLLIDPVILQPTAGALKHLTLDMLQLEDWPTLLKVGAESLIKWHALTELLRRELDEPSHDQFSAAMAQELLFCLLLSIGRLAIGQQTALTPQAVLVRRFQRELDQLVKTRPSIAALAGRLGVSTSTLSRTCQDKLGHSAKEAVDRRIALEAQRLLVHSSATAAAIGEQLGFTEPTNFVKFFRRKAGATPEEFRRSHRWARPPEPIIGL